MWITGRSTYSPLEILCRAPMFATPFFFLVFVENANQKELRFIFKFSIILIIINLVGNVFYGIAYPDILRDFNSVTFIRSICGDTSYIASLIFILWICISSFLCKFDTSKKALSILSILILIYLLSINTRATSVIVLFMMIVLFFISYFTYKKRKGVCFYIMGVFSLFAFFFLLVVPIISYAIELFSGNDILTERFVDLLSLSESGETSDTGSLGQRLILAQTSLDTFTSSPSNFIFGIGENDRGLSMSELVYGGIGNHSEFIDCFARYGLIGGIITYISIIETMKYTLRICPFKLKLYLLTLFIIFIIYGFLNNVFYPNIMVVIFGIVTVLVKLMYNSQISSSYE